MSLSQLKETPTDPIPGRRPGDGGFSSPLAELLPGRRDPRSFWFLATLCVSAAFLTAVAAFNWFIDPLQLFRADNLYVTNPQYQRFTNAGLILNSEPFDAVIIGTSSIANSDTKLVDSLFGTKTRLLSIWGGSQREQLETLGFALRTRPEIRMVFLEAAVGGWCQNVYHKSWLFPAEIYHGRPWARFAPLFSHEITEVALRKAVADRSARNTLFSPNREDVHQWDSQLGQYVGSPNRLRAFFDQTIQSEGHIAVAQQDIASKVASFVSCFQRSTLDVAVKHPHVNFYLFQPPVFQWLSHSRNRRGVIAVVTQAAEEAARLVSALPNVSYFDFYAATEVAGDCRHWLDMHHFDTETGNNLFRWMRDGRFRRTPQTNDRMTRTVLDSLIEKAPCMGPTTEPAR